MFADLTPPTRSGPISMIAVAAVLLPLATISVLLRAWVRLNILRSWGRDDWAIIATLGLFAAECGVLIKIAMIESQGITLAGGETIALVSSQLSFLFHSHNHHIRQVLTKGHQARTYRTISLRCRHNHP